MLSMKIILLFFKSNIMKMIVILILVFLIKEVV